MTEPRRLLLDIFLDALRAVDGRVRVRDFLSGYSFNAPVYLLAIGKAACAMAHGAHDVLGPAIDGALIVTKEGHAEPLPWPVREAGHPLPDSRSLDAGEALRSFVAALPIEADVLVLLSGGASALVECLPAGMDLAQLRRINEWLIGSGLDIHRINHVRKRLSLIKGGRLAQWLAPRKVTCLAISDVPGDDPRAIGSGPLIADSEVDLSFGATFPDFIRAALDQALPAPSPDDACFRRVNINIIARLEDAKQAAAAAAERRGYPAQIESMFVLGDAVESGAQLARTLRHAEAGVVHIWGGETTVCLPPQPGRGGRNQALALAAALELAECDGIYFLAAGTDGTDGPTPDAGALVTVDTIARGALQGLDARDALARSDAGTFLEASGDLIHTGPTGTNVMDLMLGFRCST